MKSIVKVGGVKGRIKICFATTKLSFETACESEPKTLPNEEIKTNARTEKKFCCFVTVFISACGEKKRIELHVLFGPLRKLVSESSWPEPYEH